ncbi:MAG: PilZ domain-containing protein [Terriglobales bacterium]
MKDSTKESPLKGSDWTRLLTDPDLVSHLGKLLQTYREVSPEKREQALLKTMREIKESALKTRAAAATASGTPTPAPLPPTVFAAPQPIAETPPFEPDLFTPQTGSDRRRFARIKCFVAVELHIEGLEGPVWGNLSNVGRGGCFVETATPIPPGKSVGIGLWVSSGKIWVKGVILNGVVTRSAPSFGVRVKFSEAELSQKEHLREFLKFIESSARKGQSGNAYVAQLKR